ncbi:molybdopterin-containing oxidoreductase family protein [Raoultibacter timonensis]|uniref:molybdopterin-containing oxidoreductase family protein n=1 Tax=Raoultibacter timonensis TaxID=1907662 RepID=UPI000C866084|nr:molybdopterin-dependent oxidoreductase [Raoultibacter timonensis]
MKQSADHGMPSLSRRTFVAAAAATGAAAVGLAGCSPAAEKEPEKEASPEVVDPYANAQVFYTSCPPECQHHNLKAYVVDGEIVKVESSEMNDCSACARGISRSYMSKDPNRLTVPLLRDGEKGSGSFKEITWDEAFDLIEEKFRDAIETDGVQSICYVTGSGNFGSMHGPVATAFFAHLGGASTTVGSLCCAGTTAAQVPIYGQRFLDTRNQIEKSDYVIVWGNNPSISKQGYFQRFERVIENGGKVVVIDPIFTESASKASEWISPWPGTDAAMALAMIKVVIDEELYDKDYTLAHTCAPCLVDKSTGEPVLEDEADPASFVVFDAAGGEIVRHDKSGVEAALTLDGTSAADAYSTEFELIYAEAAKWDVAAAEAECGVPAADIERLAREYAQADRAMIIQNMGGFMRTENGTNAVATQLYLAALCGHVGHEGDGVSDAGGVNEVKTGAPIEVPKLDNTVPAIPRFRFGEAVLNEDPLKVNVFWSMTGNPMTQWPNTNMVRKGLEKIPFVVTVDQYLTSTALYSDLVLPVAAQFEHEDVLANHRSHWIQLCEKAIDGPGEVKSDFDIFAELAGRFDFGEAFSKPMEEMISNVLEPTGVSYDELVEQKAVDVVGYDYIPYKDGQFLTKSKKAEFWVAAWKKEGFSPIATYVRAEEDARNENELASKYPLFSVQRKTYRSVHSTFNNLEWMDEVCDVQPVILLNEADAESRGIADGDTVVVYNDRGEHRGIAEVGTRIKQGVVGLQNGWWEQQGGSSSYVTNDKWKTLGGTHCCNQTLVEVKKEA